MHTHRPFVHLAIAVLTATALLLSAGCVGKPPVGGTTPAPSASAPRLEPSQEAEQAFNAGDHTRSEVLNRRLLDKGGLSTEHEIKAWRQLAESALKNNHGHVSLEALRNLARLSPAETDTWTWNDIYIRALIQVGRADQAQQYLASLLRDPSRPWDLRFRAGLSLSRDQWSQRNYTEAMQSLERLYADSPGEPSPLPKAQLEDAFLMELRSVDEPTLSALVATVPEESRWNFPYNVILLEQARRYGKAEESWPQAWQLLTDLSQQGRFADTSIVDKVNKPLSQEFGAPEGGIVLALPLTGPYAEIGWKVMRGAGAAQWETLSKGGQMQIRAINTDAPDWLDQIAALPEDYAVMGGPLRLKKFTELYNRGLTSKRPCFSFVPRLTGGVEGVDAWRFFSSTQDEVRSLLQLSVGELGVTDYGVYAPDEPFGRRLSAAFTQELTAWDASVNATATYPPGKPTEWSKITAGLVTADLTVPKEDRLPPETPFQGVFLPDGWSQAKLIAPQFFFYDEDRLLLLGPALWGQGLAKDSNVEANYFRLAVFPSPWWADNPALGAQSLRAALAVDGLGAPDSWVALGYDFIRFGVRMPPMPEAWGHGEVNSAIQAAQRIEWSMAPLSWDSAGLARQDLFLFQPTSKGAAPLDVQRLKNRLQRARVHHDKRVESLLQKQELKELQELQEKDPDNEDINTRLQLLLDRLEQEKLNRQQ